LLRLEDVTFRRPRLPIPPLRWPARKPMEASSAKAKQPKRTAGTKPKPKSAPKPQADRAAKASDSPGNAAAQQRNPAAAEGQKLRVDQAEGLKGPNGPSRASVDELAERISRGEQIDDGTLGSLNKRERRRLKKLQQTANRKTASAR